MSLFFIDYFMFGFYRRVEVVIVYLEGENSFDKCSFERSILLYFILEYLELNKYIEENREVLVFCLGF